MISRKHHRFIIILAGCLLVFAWLQGFLLPQCLGQENSDITAVPAREAVTVLQNNLEGSETDTAVPATKPPDESMLSESAPSTLSKDFLEDTEFHLKELTPTLMDFLSVLLATVLFGFFLKHLRQLRLKLRETIQTQHGLGKIPLLKFRNLDILSPKQLTHALQTTGNIGYFLILLTLSAIYLTFIFGLFPPTRGIAQALIAYISKTGLFFISALLNFLPNILAIIVISAGLYFLLKLLRFTSLAVARGQLIIPGFYREWAIPTYKIVRFLVVMFGIVMVFPYLPGYDSPAFKGIAVFLGVLFSLGSSTAVANLVAGIVLVYMRPFKIGDRVQIGNTFGDVTEMSLLVTRLRTVKNEDITLPNAMIMTHAMTNYSSCGKRGLILHTTVTLGYDIPWPKIHELLINAAKNNPYILEAPEPFVLQKSLDDFYVSYELNAYTDDPAQMMLAYSILHQNIQTNFNQAGVEIMSPHYRAIRDGNNPTIPRTGVTSG